MVRMGQYFFRRVSGVMHKYTIDCCFPRCDQMFVTVVNDDGSMFFYYLHQFKQTTSFYFCSTKIFLKYFLRVAADAALVGLLHQAIHRYICFWIMVSNDFIRCRCITVITIRGLLWYGSHDSNEPKEKPCKSCHPL